MAWEPHFREGIAVIARGVEDDIGEWAGCFLKAGEKLPREAGRVWGRKFIF